MTLLFQSYKNGKMEDLPESELIQMIGRAGRRPYESTGKAYILTKCEDVVSKNCRNSQHDQNERQKFSKVFWCRLLTK